MMHQILWLVWGSALVSYSVYADYWNGSGLFAADHKPVSLFALDSPHNKTTAQTNKINTPAQLKQAARQGVAAAQHALAIYYLTMVSQSNLIESKKQQIIVQAVDWLKKAVAQQNLDAMRDLAYLYYQGIGVNKDLARAKQLLLEPVKQGNAFAMQLWKKIENKHLFRAQNGYNKSDTDKNKDSTFTRAILMTWKQAWQNLDSKQYLQFYSKKFMSAKGNYHQWAKYKKGIFRHASQVRIYLKNIKITRHNHQAIVCFDQSYHSDSYSDTVYKELHWQWEPDEKWRIIREIAIKKTTNHKYNDNDPITK